MKDSPPIPTGYKRTEVGLIPEDWEVMQLDDIGTWRGGMTPSMREPNYWRGGIVPWISSGDVKSSKLTVTGYYVTEYAIKHCRTILIPANSIVVVFRSGILRKFLPVAMNMVPMAINQDIKALLPKGSISSDYILQYLISYGEKILSKCLKSGTTVESVELKWFKSFTILLPPLPEQRAIAEALSDVDELINALDQLIAKKRDIKQATMQQLLTGKKRLPGFSDKWVAKFLGNCIISRPDYGINAPSVPFLEKLPSYLRITDISEQGRYCPNPRVCVGAKDADQFCLQEGDIVFARTGASVGKSYLYNKKDGQLVFAGFLIRVHPDPSILIPAFLAAYTTTGPYWNWVRLMSMRSGQPGINGNEYAQLPISLPPIPEQRAIAEVLSDMDAEIAALEQRRDKTRALKQGMMQELLTGKTRLV